MPPLILIATKWLGLLGMIVTVLTGSMLTETVGSPIRFSTGMISTALLGVAQMMTFRYFIGDNRAILSAAKRHGLPPNVPAEAAAIRRLVIPRSYLVLVLTAATLIAGGATLLATIPAWPHIGLAIATTLAGLYTAFIEYIAFRFNAALNDRVAAMTEPAPS